MEDYEARFLASLFSITGTFVIMAAITGTRSPSILYATLLALLSSLAVFIIRRKRK